MGVNKAKAMLLSPTPATDPVPPAARLETPEKVQHDKCQTRDREELAESLSSLSATLRLASTAAPNQEGHEKADKQSGLTEDQAQRIKENRARNVMLNMQCGVALYSIVCA